jgi:HEAT repeat protein
MVVNYKALSPAEVDYGRLSPDELIGLFAYISHRQAAIVALVGGLTATEFRRITLTDAARDALIRGLAHPNPKVRWWCLQLMDHVGDEACIEHIVRALADPVPRVRKMALHALECEKCKASPAMIEAGRRALARHAASDVMG